MVVYRKVCAELVGSKKRFFSCWLESNTESEIGFSSVEDIDDLNDLIIRNCVILVVAPTEGEGNS